MPSASTLGERLRELRLAAGLSQRALASKVEVSFPHISKIESGDERPSEKLIEDLAVALGADADELLLLGNRLPDDLAEVVVEKASRAPEFLRSWRAGEISDDDIDKLLRKARRKQG